MAWEISMSDEGWRNVRHNLSHWSEEKLIEALCEEQWSRVHDLSGGSMLHADRASSALRSRLALYYWHGDRETLAGLVMNRIEAHNTCDNGGHAVWIDSEGYQTVPVSLDCDCEEEEEEEA